MEHFKKREISSLDFQWYSIDIRIRKIRGILDWKNDVNKLKLSEEVFCIPLTWAEFVLLYSNKEKRERDIKLFKEKFKQKGIFSEEISPWIQIVNPIWPFEYNWMIWLWVEWLNNYNDTATNLENWLYRWIILDPEKYFWIWEKTKILQTQTIDGVQNIIENK